MAVLIQPMIAARTAGVTYSIHPVTGRRNQVMINAIPGLAAPLVDGTITPDQYVVEVASDGEPTQVRTRVLADKSHRLSVSHEGYKQIPSKKGLSTARRSQIVSCLLSQGLLNKSNRP